MKLLKNEVSNVPNRKSLKDRLELPVQIATLIISLLTLLWLVGFLKRPRMGIRRNNEIVLHRENNKLSFDCFESMINSGGCTGFIKTFEAQVSPVDDDQSFISFEAKYYQSSGQPVQEFMDLGLKDGDLPLRATLDYKQRSFIDFRLKAGDYIIKYSYLTYNQYPWLFGETSTVTEFVRMTLRDADIQKLYQPKGTKESTAITIKTEDKR